MTQHLLDFAKDASNAIFGNTLLMVAAGLLGLLIIKKIAHAGEKTALATARMAEAVDSTVDGITTLAIVFFIGFLMFFGGSSRGVDGMTASKKDGTVTVQLHQQHESIRKHSKQPTPKEKPASELAEEESRK